VVSLELLFHLVLIHLDHFYTDHHQLGLRVFGDRIMLSREMSPEKESYLPMLRGIEEWAKDHQSDPAHHIDLLLQCLHLIHYLWLKLLGMLLPSVTMNNIVNHSSKESILSTKKFNKSIKNNMK
jgi:hypothetical protein